MWHQWAQSHAHGRLGFKTSKAKQDTYLYHHLSLQTKFRHSNELYNIVGVAKFWKATHQRAVSSCHACWPRRTPHSQLWIRQKIKCHRLLSSQCWHTFCVCWHQLSHLFLVFFGWRQSAATSSLSLVTFGHYVSLKQMSVIDQHFTSNPL